MAVKTRIERWWPTPALSLILSLAYGPLASAQADLEGTLVVANRLPGAGSVSLFDLPTGAEIARLPIGPVIPHEIAVSPDGTTAVTGEYGPGDNRGRRVVVIDIVAARIRGYVDLGPVSRPHSFAFLPDGRRIVATMEDADRIALIDLPTLAVVRTFPTGGRDGHMVRLSPDGAQAFVASRGGDGTLSIIELNQDLPPVVIRTGAGAEGLAVAPDGTEVWVANRSEATISVVDTVTREVTATLPAPLRAGRVAISAGGRVVVPSAITSRGLDVPLAIYDIGSRQVVAGQQVSDDTPSGAVSLDVVAERLFAVDRGASSIAIYDLSDLSRLAVIATGHPDPDGVGYSPLRVGVMTTETPQ